MPHYKLPRLDDVPYPELSGDPKKAVKTLGQIMGIPRHLINSVNAHELATVLAGLFFYRFLKQSERIQVLTLASQLGNTQLFALIQSKAADMLVNKDWEIWSQNAEELMRSEAFNNQLVSLLSTFGFGATFLAGKDLTDNFRTATQMGTKNTVVGQTAKRLIVVYALGTAVLLASAQRQQQLSREIERRKRLTTSRFYR